MASAKHFSFEEEPEKSYSSDQEDEEEAFSLCDLAIKADNDENQQVKQENQNRDSIRTMHGEEFEFQFGPPPLGAGGGRRSVGGDFSTMCAADDIFFRGQILPQRFSFSCDSSRSQQPNAIQVGRKSEVSRSESMDHFGPTSMRQFTSFSNRSHHDSSKPRVLNNFHSHPSPKPQVRLPPSNYTARNSFPSSPTPQPTSFWDVFRIGLVRTPGMALQDLKARSGSGYSSSSISRTSSTNSSSNISNSTFKSGSSFYNTEKGFTRIKSPGSVNNKNGTGNSSDSLDQHTKNKQKQRKQRFAALLSGCSCTVSSVKPVPLNHASTTTTTNNNNKQNNGSESRDNDKSHNIVVLKSSNKVDVNSDTSLEDKLKELKIKKRQELLMMQQQQQKQHEKKGLFVAKQEMSRNRTIEWLKELSSHESYLHQH